MVFDLQFVDSISATPTVRLDIDATPWLTRLGTRFDPPPMKYAVVDTLLADGEHIPASAYGDRTISLRLRLLDVTEDEAAEQLQLLFRELNRPTNFLRYRPRTSNPVWFRTKRCSADAVDFDPVEKTVAVQVPAEPFAYGLPVTLPEVTVTTNPAAVSNGLFFDVSGVSGDVDAVTKIVENGGLWFNNTVIFATRRRGDLTAVPFATQAEACTQGTDTTVQANDPTMSGAGSNYSRCTFATQTGMVERLSIGVFPATTSPDTRGQYRIYARMRHSVATDNIDVKIGIAPYGINSIQYSSTVRLQNTTNTRLYDFGLFSVPFGIDPVFDGPSGQMLDVAQYEIQIHAQRVSGTGNVDFDFFLAVPADDQFAAIKVGNDSAGSGYVLDSYNDMVYAHLTGSVDASADISVAGMLPTLRPGVTNRVYVITGDGFSTLLHPDLTVTYWPRFLLVGPPA